MGSLLCSPIGNSFGMLMEAPVGYLLRVSIIYMGEPVGYLLRVSGMSLGAPAGYPLGGSI